MVKQYENTARLLGLSPEQMHGVRGDLLADEDNSETDSPEFADFNVAVISMALHHVADPATMVRKLAERLQPSGSLVIVDWVADEATLPMPSEHPAAHTVTRHGFSEDQIRSMFVEAKMVDYEYLLNPERSKVPSWGEPQLFLARAKRPVQ
jgi:SAM-dependent methyltransferase